MADKIYDVGRFRHSIDNWQLSMLLGIIFFIVGIVVFGAFGIFKAVRMFLWLLIGNISR